MQKELPKLIIDPKVEKLIPLAYKNVYTKELIPANVEARVKFHSEKFNRIDFMSQTLAKPISKIIVYNID